MRSVLSCFLRHDHGAVTLDWVALSGGLLLLAAGLLTSLSGPAAGSLLAVLARAVPPLAEAPSAGAPLGWNAVQRADGLHAGDAGRDSRTGDARNAGRGASMAGDPVSAAIAEDPGPGRGGLDPFGDRIAAGAPAPH